MEGLRVCDVITSDVTALKRNDKLTLADDIMHLGRIRHLPVLDDDGQQIVGVVSQRDLFRGALARVPGYGRRAQRKGLRSRAWPGCIVQQVAADLDGSQLSTGATIVAGDVNFGGFSRQARRVESLSVLRWSCPDTREWPAFVPDARPGQVYAYRVSGPSFPEHCLRLMEVAAFSPRRLARWRE